MTLQSFEISPWLSLHQIIHYFKSKGGKFSSLSRDTFERRVSSLCETGELEKVNVRDLPSEELNKISHNKTFKFVYRISSKVNKIHETILQTSSYIAIDYFNYNFFNKSVFFEDFRC